MGRFTEFFELGTKELRQIIRPYYLVNLVLCLSFLFLKLVHPFCDVLFSSAGQEACELDMRENEIFFFLLIVVMIR
jgi:hypothetical protein